MPFPDICLVDRESCPDEWPFLNFFQYTDGSQTVELKESCGDPVDLTKYTKICLIARAYFGWDKLLINKDATVVGDPKDGRVRVVLTAAGLADPGILLGEYILYEGDRPKRRFRCYVEVAESLEHQGGQPRALSIQEVRFVLMDRCIEDNFLLDRLEFSDQQIAWAIRRPVDMWNATPPPIGTYTVTNFPYRYYWANAAAGELLKMAARNYARNNLRYSAANLQVNDKDKAKEYIALGQDLLDEYKEWMLLEKRRINMERAMGTTSIPVFGSFRSAQGNPSGY